MRLRAAIISLLSPTAAFTPGSTAGTDELAAQAFRNLIEYDAQIHSSHPPPYGRPPSRYGRPSPDQSCNLLTAYVRREWTTFTPAEKRHYIDSVLCMMEKPSISGDCCPGCRSRFDDFLGTHINQTGSIHGTGNFLSWHRYFTWTYEQALRNECGYQGYQPYLNYGRYALDLLNAPVFDGSDISMSGNGAKITFNGTNIPSNAQPDIFIPPGVGGGCVDSGPFKNLTVRLGPGGPAMSDVPPNPAKDFLGLNPRCLRRDISSYAASHWVTDQNVTDLIAQNNDVGSFQTTMQGDFPSGFLGVHTGGHFLVGGDPGGDLFASPGDPYFYLHHAQIDRIWWIWQNLDPWERYDVIAGTITINNMPPSRNATLDDLIELGVNAPGIKIREAVDTLDGPFCYIYQ